MEWGFPRDDFNQYLQGHEIAVEVLCLESHVGEIVQAGM